MVFPMPVTVTACDNELIILAYNKTGSFELCRILSGNGNAVNITLNIQSGMQYTGPQVLNGVNDPLSATLYAYLDPGQYWLLLLGIDWGGAQQFTVGFNGQTYKLPSNPNGATGLVFNPGPIPFTVL